jgi:hypothetical protein
MMGSGRVFTRGRLLDAVHGDGVSIGDRAHIKVCVETGRDPAVALRADGTASATSSSTNDG